MTEELKERLGHILDVVINQYIKTAKPVGSEEIVKDHNLKISPATVRNLFSQLEDLGYLTHPYTSAGRVPTDKGYHFYVDMILRNQKDLDILSWKEMERIEREYMKRKKSVDEVIRFTSKLLSAISDYAGFISSPKISKDNIQRIEVVSLPRGGVALIIISKEGLLRYKTLKLSFAVPIDDLNLLKDVLNSELEEYDSYTTRRTLFAKMKGDYRDNNFLKLYKEICIKMIEDIEEDIYIEGLFKVLDKIKNSDRIQMSSLFQIMESKNSISDIIKRKIDEEGVKVLIGESDLYPEMKECSIIAANYRTRDNACGAVGIIGPKRMEYTKIIPLVRFVSIAVNKFL